MTQNVIEELRAAIHEFHRAQNVRRQLYEDYPQVYSDACDVESDAHKALVDLLTGERNLAAHLLVVVEKAKRVTDYDWSDNDDDAVADMDALRNSLSPLLTTQGKTP